MPFKGNNSHNASAGSPPYPVVDGALINPPWDTANAGYCVAGAYWSLDDEFNIYILRANAANATMTTARTLSLYKYAIIPNTLTKLVTVSGAIFNSGETSYTGWLTSRGLYVNTRNNYFIFSENNTFLYFCDLTTGIIKSSINSNQSMTGFTAFTHANRRDVWVFANSGVVSQSCFVQLVTTDATNTTINWGAKILPNLGALANTWEMQMYPSIIAPTSITLTPGQIFCMFLGHSTTSNSYAGLGIFDTNTSSFTQNISLQTTTGGDTSLYPSGANIWPIANYLVCDNSLLFVYNQYAGGNTTDLYYLNWPFTGLVAGIPDINSGKIWKTTGNKFGFISSQRYDKKFFANWDFSNKIWFQRGTPAIGQATNIGTAPFSTYTLNASYVVGANPTNALVFTTSGLALCGVVANTTTASPFAFIPLANTGG